MKFKPGIVRAAVPVLGMTVLAAACATTGYHYSQVEGTRYNKTPIDTYPVTILSIDGKSSLERRIQIDPGMRHFVLQAPPGGGQSVGLARPFDLEVAPCTRYYLVAVKQNPLLQDFTTKVDFQEPVSGCTPPQ